MYGDEISTHEEQILTDFRKIRLCTYVLNELIEELEQPLTPKEKANLLIAVEDLTSSAIVLLHQTRDAVWTEDLQQPTENS